jgi:hypothetical protein
LVTPADVMENTALPDLARLGASARQHSRRPGIFMPRWCPRGA